MDVVFDNISSLIVFTILFLVVYAALLNVYFIRKNGFHVSVNCWFCNKNSKVLYRKRNSFECPHCSQYNGFNKNGDYNKVIEAQHNATFNNLMSNEKTGYLTTKPSNGLCEACNKNQQLRVIQLANYEPLDNKNYEKEVEHFEKQLEKTYKLCKRCSDIVKNTIRKQNAWIFGNRLRNFKSPSKKGLGFKTNKKSQRYKEDTKFSYKLSIGRCILLILSAFNLVILCSLDDFIPEQFLPYKSLPSNVIFSNAYSKVYNVTTIKFGNLSFMKYFPKTVNVPETNVLPISLIGLSIELLFMSMENNVTSFGKLSKLLSWVLLGFLSVVHFKSDISIHISTLQVFCCLWLMYNYGSSHVSLPQNHSKKFVLKRLRKSCENIEYSDNEESSSESLNDSVASFQTATIKRSPVTASSLNNSINRSFESVQSKISPLLNSSFINNSAYTAKNVELNKHFNELNLGAFDANRPLSTQSIRSTSSPNPFLNHNSRAQSPNSFGYNYGMAYNNPASSLSMRAPQSNLFKLHSPQVNSNFGNVVNSSLNENHTSGFLNQSGRLSPRSDQFERMSVQTEPFGVQSKLINSSYNREDQRSASFLHLNMFNTSIPGDNNSVYSQHTAMNKSSPTYSLRSQGGQNRSFRQNSHQTVPNHTFRPLSPNSTMERPNRTPLSHSRMNNIKSFHSDAKENDNLSLSFHMANLPTSSLFSNMNNSQMSQRFVVNSVTNMQPSSPLNGSFVSGNADKNMWSNSRSSSSSSGFVSNGEFGKVLTRSLPSSRDHSPDRNSLLSEPAYHFKTD